MCSVNQNSVDIGVVREAFFDWLRKPYTNTENYRQLSNTKRDIEQSLLVPHENVGKIVNIVFWQLVCELILVPRENGGSRVWIF